MTYLKVQCNHFYWWPLTQELEALDGDASDEIFAGIAYLTRTSTDLCLDTTNSVKWQPYDTL